MENLIVCHWLVFRTDDQFGNLLSMSACVSINQSIKWRTSKVRHLLFQQIDRTGDIDRERDTVTEKEKTRCLETWSYLNRSSSSTKFFLCYCFFSFFFFFSFIVSVTLLLYLFGRIRAPPCVRICECAHTNIDRKGFSQYKINIYLSHASLVRVQYPIGFFLLSLFFSVRREQPNSKKERQRKRKKIFINLLLDVCCDGWHFETETFTYRVAAHFESNKLVRENKREKEHFQKLYTFHLNNK